MLPHALREAVLLRPFFCGYLWGVLMSLEEERRHLNTVVLEMFMGGNWS
jgi:hypothetical protein